MFTKTSVAETALLLTRIAQGLCLSGANYSDELDKLCKKAIAKSPPEQKRKIKEIIEVMKCIVMKKSVSKWVRKSNIEIARSIINWVKASK